MPLYDLKCENCKSEYEGVFTVKDIETYGQRLPCKLCGMPAARVLITNYHNEDWFKPHWNEHFDVEPQWVRSRNHLKELCDKYGMVSNALGDHRNIKEI